jgi:hypothetical protein
MYHTQAKFQRQSMEMMKDLEVLQVVVTARKKLRVKRPRRGLLKVTPKLMVVRKIRRVLLTRK